MKKTILTLLLCSTTFFAFAQQGQFWLGGSVQYAYSNANGSKSHSLNIAPSAEFYLADTWSVYGGPVYEYQKEVFSLASIEDQSYQVSTQSSIGGIVFGVIKYFPLNDKLALYARFESGGGWGTASYGTSNYTVSRYNMALTPGINYLLSDNIAACLEFGKGLRLDTSYYTNKNDTGNIHNEFNISADILTPSISLGLMFRLK